MTNQEILRVAMRHTTHTRARVAEGGPEWESHKTADQAAFRFFRELLADRAKVAR